MHRRELRFALLVTAAHLAVALFAIAHHEMWRDEVHSWLVARDSASPWQVIRNHAYDGHPPLWYLFLWGIQRLTSSVRVMQAAHVAIAAANVFLVARYAPFGRLPRALFAFGYFAVYEYAAISRGYGLALLFALLLCIRHARRLERPLVTGLLVACLTRCATVSTIAGAAYCAVLLLDLRKDRRALVPLAFGAAAFLFATWCAYPPADSTVARLGDLPSLGWDYAPTRLVVGLVPIPKADFYYWNSSAVLGWLPRAAAFPLSVALGAWILFAVSRARAAVVLFAAGALALMALFGIMYSGDVRHHGFFFVLFVMAAWLAWPKRRVTLAPTLVAILALHVPAAMIAIGYDHRYVFSSGARAAAALRARGLESAPIVAEEDYAATAVIGHLGPRVFGYSPRNGKPFSFVRWTGDRIQAPTDDQIVAFAARLGASRGDDAVLVMNRPLPPPMVDGVAVTRLDELYDSMIQAENFFLYRVQKGPGAPGALGAAGGTGATGAGLR